jgi:hypothetical protein
MSGDTAVFDTAIVTETQPEKPDITNAGGALQ